MGVLEKSEFAFSVLISYLIAQMYQLGTFQNLWLGGGGFQGRGTQIQTENFVGNKIWSKIATTMYVRGRPLIIWGGAWSKSKKKNLKKKFQKEGLPEKNILISMAVKIKKIN